MSACREADFEKIHGKYTTKGKVMEREISPIGRVDAEGNIFYVSKSRVPHWDFLHDAVVGSHYELCGIDNELTSIEDGVYTFVELDPPEEIENTFVEFRDGEAWMIFDSVVPFDPWAGQRKFLEAHNG